MSWTVLLWIIWAVVSLCGGAALAALMLVGGQRDPFLIGETTGVHAQFEMTCQTCHAASLADTSKKTVKALNKTCTTCHDAELKASNDSHPRKKFRDPRMADFWEQVDARLCTSCHVEHKPEITRPGAVTLAMDYCVACHSKGEQDVRVDRPSHAGLGFATCASAGCHNFHDNRALYEDFLVKHADAPWLAEVPVHRLEAAQRTSRRERTLIPLTVVAPMKDGPEIAIWSASAHAAEVGCASCHAPEAGTDPGEYAILANWIDKPGSQGCAKCHKAEAKTYRIGRHGMRQHPKIAKPRDPVKELKALGIRIDRKGQLAETLRTYLADPERPSAMTVAETRLTMKSEAHGRTLSCISCHGPHEADTRKAAVEACASCHNDRHTQGYFASKHYALWRAETAGEAAAGTGVSCATCHLPKEETSRGIVTNHNQNDILRPNEKMIRPVCMDCHGLGYAIDALADADLVARNFQGAPSVHIESIEWAARRVRDRDQGTNQ